LKEQRNGTLKASVQLLEKLSADWLLSLLSQHIRWFLLKNRMIRSSWLRSMTGIRRVHPPRATAAKTNCKTRQGQGLATGIGFLVPVLVWLTQRSTTRRSSGSTSLHDFDQVNN
jgi:hypothetical protein